MIRTDLFTGIRAIFDLVLFNPPYLPTEPGERIDDWLEYALDGGESGRDVIERFASGVGRVLSPEGRILLLVSSLTGPDEVRELFHGHGFSSTIAVQQIVEGEELSVMRFVREKQSSENIELCSCKTTTKMFVSRITPTIIIPS